MHVLVPVEVPSPRPKWQNERNKHLERFCMKYLRNNKALILSILTIALPAIVEMSLNTLVGVFDTIFVSRFLGPDALSAAGYANQIIFTVIFIFSAFNIGATAMIARNYGEKNYERLNQVMGHNMTLNLIAGVVVTALCALFGRNILGIFTITPEVRELSQSFLDIIVYSQFFMFISFAAAASMRGFSNTKTPMYITGLVNIINIIGNYVLITGFWIFPEMGIRGSAMSTLIARAIGAVIFVVLLFKDRGGIQLKLKHFPLTGPVLRSLWKLSSTAGLEQLLIQSSFFVMGMLISILDTTSEAAFRILVTVESTSFMPAIGLSIAAASLLGKSLGEGDREKARKIGYISMGMGILWGFAALLLFNIFPRFIMGIFTSETAIIDASVLALRVAGWDQPLFALTLVIAGALRGAGDTRRVMWLTTARQWVFFIPISWMLLSIAGLGVESVYMAEIVALLVVNFLFLKRFRGGRWAEIQI